MKSLWVLKVLRNRLAGGIGRSKVACIEGRALSTLVSAVAQTGWPYCSAQLLLEKSSWFPFCISGVAADIW